MSRAGQSAWFSLPVIASLVVVVAVCRDEPKTVACGSAALLCSLASLAAKASGLPGGGVALLATIALSASTAAVQAERPKTGFTFAAVALVYATIEADFCAYKSPYAIGASLKRAVAEMRAPHLVGNLLATRLEPGAVVLSLG